jgi:hypothetical protein
VRALSASGDVFIAPDGRDSNPGSKAKPFATLERARTEVRSLKRLRKADTAFTVWLGGGDYIRTNTLELSAEDSGSASYPVTWRAQQGARVRLLGGRKLEGARPLSDRVLLQRLPGPARGRVLTIDLRAAGIGEFGAMKSRGFSRPLSSAHCELFCDGKPLTLARWPNEGSWEKIAGFPEENAEDDGHGGKIGRLENGFFYEGDRPRAWRYPEDIWVHGYWSWDWANSYERVTSIDLEKRLIKTAPPRGLYGFRKGQRFQFLNVFEELDQPGEWFLDGKAGALYFWPPDDTAAKQPELLLSLLDQPLLSLKDASHVTVRGLTLEATRASGAEIRGGTSNRIAGCTLRNLGNYGVRIEGGTGHGVVGCDVFDTGDGGVSLEGGDRKTLAAAGHVVDNCHFARQGRWSKCYVPAVLIGGVGMRASHNLIHDHPHCAILYGGNDHVIELNEIHHIALETGDVGAIYTGRDYTYRGNRLLHNFIHETGGVGMGSMGAYMDDCVSGTEIYGNVFYKVQRAAFLGGGRDHPVVNNIFVDCNYAVELDGRGLDKSPVWHNQVDKTMRQRLKEVPLALYRERYPAMKTLDAAYGPPEGPAIEGGAFKGVPPEGNVVARNVCVGKWLNVYWHAKLDMLRVENNLTNAATEFVRVPGSQPKATDFALKPDSQAWKLGFEKIPLEKIGLYDDEFRRGLAAGLQ